MIEVYLHENLNDSTWDEFISTNSVNGTFLQSRNFLNYHAERKFDDCSILIGSTHSDLYAVIPGCIVIDGEKKGFSSHSGSTYGGPVISKKHYNLRDISLILGTFEEHLRTEGFRQVVLRITPDIFSLEKTDLLQYLLTISGYKQYTELSTYIDFSNYYPDILSNFSYARLKQYKKCEKAGMKFRHINTDTEVSIFYNLLEASLARYQVKPVHSLDELLEFKNKRLNDIVDFYCVELNGEVIASSMSFYFCKTDTLHIQYSAAQRGIGTLSPMTYLFWGLINEAKNNGIKILSWGISTEERGSKLNMALAETKESYGSKFSINRTFYKELT